MTLHHKNFESLSEKDLLEQIAAGVPEGLLVDYKQAAYGGSDADVKEFLKDASSFANSEGGHLIIGVEEEGGLPTRLSPIKGDADKDLQRLESLLRNGLEPRIVGIRAMSIPIADGGYVLIFRIPKSWNPPHRVIARGTNRIYGRNASGTYEFSIEELRVVFTSAANALDRVRAFRSERLARIESGDAAAPLAQNNGRLVVHLVPASAFSLRNQIDIEKAYATQALLRPMAMTGYSPTINFDGFANLNHGADGRCWSYVQIFRNGALEAVKVRVTSDPRSNGVFWIPTLSLDRAIFEQLPNYMQALQKLEIPPPVVVMITLQGVRGARLGVEPRPLDDDERPFDRDVIALPECIIENYGSEIDYQRAVRPAFDALWNAGGYFKSKHFADDGKWTAGGR